MDVDSCFGLQRTSGLIFQPRDELLHHQPSASTRSSTHLAKFLAKFRAVRRGSSSKMNSDEQISSKKFVQSFPQKHKVAKPPNCQVMTNIPKELRRTTLVCGLLLVDVPSCPCTFAAGPLLLVSDVLEQFLFLLLELSSRSRKVFLFLCLLWSTTTARRPPTAGYSQYPWDRAHVRAPFTMLWSKDRGLCRHKPSVR